MVKASDKKQGVIPDIFWWASAKLEKIKVKLLKLGYPPIDLAKVGRWKSRYFYFEKPILQKSNLPDSDGEGWSYSKKILSKIIGSGKGADITIGVTDKPIESNYYLHRLSDNTCVLSFYEISGILATEHIPTEIFLIRNVYEMVSLYFEFGGKVSAGAYKAHHEDTRGCLYDFNAIKTDILASTRRVVICDECRARLVGRKLPMGFVDGISGELKKVRKPLIFEIADFVKAHPVWSLVISLVVSAAVNVFSNYIFYLLVK